jgi:hypothetical protein
MAVYSNPKHVDQTVYKLNSYICLRRNQEDVSIPPFHRFPRMGEGRKIILNQLLHLYEHPLSGPVTLNEETEESIFIKRMLDQANQIDDSNTMHIHAKVGNLKAKILRECKEWA